MRPIFIVLVLLSVGVTSAMDVAGAWTLSYRNEEGQTRESTLTLKSGGFDNHRKHCKFSRHGADL